jgi:GNAT superfamily N-acetyltransferase
MALTIRPAVDDDASALTALMHASAAYRGTYAQILQGYEITAEQIRHDRMFLATDGGRVQGFYSLANVESDPELDLLFVADAAQGSGIGALLFEHMRRMACELGVDRVKIVSHPPALRFYTRMGAEVVGMEPPTARVSWERPVLVLDVRAPRHAAAEPETLGVA